MSISDFDDDFDDILQSDEDIPKKPKSTGFINNLNDNNKVTEPKISENTDIIKKKEKSYTDKLFDKETDHFVSSENNKTKGVPIKPAKSVLESLLNPAKELNDINFSFDKSSSSNTIKTDLNDRKNDEFLFKNEYRPSTANVKEKETLGNSLNKRTVRFSTEILNDDEFDLNSSVNYSRPQTAPTNIPDTGKPKFLSRFEAAEFDETPIKSYENNKFNNGSDSNLWHELKSDEFISVSGNETKSNYETTENKTKDNNRSLPKQKLSEFMQSTQDELSFTTPDKVRLSNFNEISSTPLSGNSRRSSHEDLLDGRRKTSIIDEFDLGSRPSLSKDTSYDRPKTAHSRHDRLQIMGDYQSDVLSADVMDYQLKIKHLESERNELLYKLDNVTKRNIEELAINERTYKNRIELLEESMKSKEKRLKEEIDLLSEQNKQKLQILEQERLEMRSELARRQDEIENQKRQEISRIREQHKLEVDKLRFNHEDLIEKLKQAKTDEDITIRMAQPTTVQLQSVLTQVSNGAQDLVTIKEQLMQQLNHQIKEKDTQLREKNEYLRQLEERLEIQKDENMKERERLQSLISKLDIQLKDHMRNTEEERWFLRQEQNKLSALQISLDKEREQILIEKDQNHLSHEESRKRLLEEQKQMFDQLYEEKRNMAEERAKLTREMFKWSESNQMSNIKKNQDMAELEGLRSAIFEERQELNKMKAQIASDRDELKLKLTNLDSLSTNNRIKSEKLNAFEMELNNKQKLINDKEHHYREIEMKSEDAFKKAKELHSGHDDQILKIQRQLNVLNEKEQHVSKQSMELEKLRTELVNKEKAHLCYKCSNSLRKSAITGSYNNLNNNYLANGILNKEIGVPNSTEYHTRVNYEFMNSLDYTSMLASQMEEERLIHSIKLAAENDREFLSQERAYLDSLAKGSQSSFKNHARS